MRIPINAARMLLSLVVEKSHPYVSAAISGRLNRIGLDESFLIDSLTELTQVHNELLAEEPDVTSWPGLSGEFSALFSWLMQDLKTSETSVEFDKDLSRANIQGLADLGIAGPYPPELKLKIHHWVVGACWSASTNQASALVFPLKTLALDKQQAGIAYNGLVRHLQTLEALGLEGDPGPDLEMSVSSIAIRVVALAEALNPEFQNKAAAALDRQLRAKFGSSTVKTEIKKEIEKVWHSNAIEELVLSRHSLSHVSSQKGIPFSRAVSALSGEKIQALSELASTLIAAEILYRLEDVNEYKVLQWLDQFMRQLENRNLSALRSNMPVEFKVNPLTGAPSQLVTPLG